jgi:hypothetical protein
METYDGQTIGKGFENSPFGQEPIVYRLKEVARKCCICRKTRIGKKYTRCYKCRMSWKILNKTL